MDALARAYQTNPQINAERAALRATDELVPIAKSGQRPQVSASGTGALGITATNPEPRNGGSTRSRSLSLGVQAQQNVFAGFRNRNSVRQAETNVLAGRARLDATVQNVLLNAVAAYADVLQQGAILGVRRESIEFFNRQLQAARDRFEVGEVTRTDVAQAEAGLNRSVADAGTAEGALAAARARYAELVGAAPNNLQPIPSITKKLPNSLDRAIAVSREFHPTVRSASFNADAAQFDVKIAEADLYPTVSVSGSADRTYTPDGRVDRADSLGVQAQINVPIFTGGRTSAQIRRSKQVLGQRQIELDLTRVQVESAVIAAFAALQTSAFAVEAGTAEVRAARSAVDGVVEEARVGQRTTLDVLDAQNTLNLARIRFIQAQRDQSVSAYQLLSAIGKLEPATLGLHVREYKPETHYRQVRDKWFGLRTPSGN